MNSTITRGPSVAAPTEYSPGTVAVIGGGAAGSLTAAAIARDPAWRTVLISPEERPGRGVAYGTAEPWHLLNSRAVAMSADPDDPGHLLRWCHERGLPADAATFLPRTWYGEYLADHFRSAAGSRLTHHRATATGVRRTAPASPGGGYVVTDDTGAEIRVDHVVLALGNPPPCVPSAVSATARRDVAFVADPWAPGALGAVPADEPVLLLGTGLTAVDVALTLTRDGRTVPIDALSRRGLPPLAHPARPAPAVTLDLPSSPILAPLVRRVREAIADGADWTAVIDHVRTQSDRLWAALEPDAQERFLRHLQRYWEVHRHRMAPPIAARIAGLRSQGLLNLRRGHLTSIEPDPRGGLLVHLHGEPPKRYGAVITCTGPGPLPCSAGPLLAGLIRDGLVRTGPHGLGIETDPDGRAGPGLWLAGPLRRGLLWESTAVPEIRGQAARLAAALPARASVAAG
ncbi:FAD/NAD(P)-binding protein [Actinoplanes utahensis]|uniref:FAD/NAD(P)-binding protein n=1 Tax=Actinoplanes utahensis TaxID=1869 RepID=UPI000A7FB849|nr:FAD/NAD(P)-binding protein [Actinoplanes utahensis]